MSSRTRGSRYLIVLCAFVQFILPGPLGILDAISAENARDTVAHVEETGSRQCQPPHCAECIICRHLSTGFTRSEPVPSVDRQIARAELLASAELNLRSVSRRGFQPRAPPEGPI